VDTPLRSSFTLSPHKDLKLERLPNNNDLYSSEVEELLDRFEVEEIKNQIMSLQNTRDESTQSKESEQNQWIVLRRLGALRGGVKIRLPSTIEELVNIGSDQLQIKGIKVREYLSEAAITDISAIESDILYLTTEEEERLF